LEFFKTTDCLVTTQTIHLPFVSMSRHTNIIPIDSKCNNSIAFGRNDGNQPCLALGQRNGEIALWTQATLGKVKGCSDKLQGHTSDVFSLAFSSSGQEQLLASGSSDCTVRLWDMHTRECVAVLEGHKHWVNSVAFSPDDRLLASASDDCTVRLWDVVERRANFPVHVLRGHTSYVCSVSFSPDGRQLASGSFDRTVRLWNVPDGVPGPVLQHPAIVLCVAFSSVVGSNMLASGCGDSIVRLWDVSGVIKRELQGHSNWIQSVAFSPDDSQLVSGSQDNTVRLWSVASGKHAKVMTEHSEYVCSAVFHPNGKQVVSCSWGRKAVQIDTVCEWSDRTHQLFGEEIKRLVFCLMCIKENIEKNKPTLIVPQLPMELWLVIFAFLCL
jgi:WD40 repeat protein